jgi:ATP-dependent RNA helicase RhlB
VHRIGRTARAGEYGDAISFGCEDYAVNLPDIEAYIGRRIPVEPVDAEFLVPLERAVRRRPPEIGPGGNRGRSGGRGRPPRRRNDHEPSGRQRDKQDEAGPQATPGAADAANTASAAETTDAPPAKKRRRRRRHKSGPATAGGHDGEASSPSEGAGEPKTPATEG